MGFENLSIGHVDCLHASDERMKCNIKGRDRIVIGAFHTVGLLEGFWFNGVDECCEKEG